MDGYLVILTVAPDLYISTVPLPTKLLKSAVRLSSDKVGISAFRKQQRARMPLVTFFSYSPIDAYR